MSALYVAVPAKEIPETCNVSPGQLALFVEIDVLKHDETIFHVPTTFPPQAAGWLQLPPPSQLSMPIVIRLTPVTIAIASPFRMPTASTALGAGASDDDHAAYFLLSSAAPNRLIGP